MPTRYPNSGPGGQSCRLCNYYQYIAEGKGNGMCRRYPPPAASTNQAISARDYFPQTTPQDWCGEFSLGGQGASAGSLVIPTPTPDGIADTFTAAGLINVSLVFVNGDVQSLANYTVTGNQVTFAPGSVPQPGDLVQIFGN